MVRRRASVVLRALLAATSLGLVAVAPAFADHEPARLGLTPVGQDGTFFQLAMRPGEQVRLEVEAANFGHEKAAARTYAADVYSIVNGGFGADLFGEPPAATTLWVHYPTQELTLGPQDAVVIEFEVSVPEAAAPGEYVAALVIENSEPVVSSGTLGFEQVNRSAIAISIRVPGPETPALEIREVHYKEVTGVSVVMFEVANTGNVHLRPAGDFVLRRVSTEIAAAPVSMDSVYAGTSTLLEAPIVELLSSGDYCAELRLTDASTGASATTECLAFEVPGPVDAGGPIPEISGVLGGAIRDSPLVVVALLLAAAVAGLFLVIWRRRRRAAPPGAEAAGALSARDGSTRRRKPRWDGRTGQP